MLCTFDICMFIDASPNVSVTAVNCELGLRVGRGKDWIWQQQDYLNGVPGLGTVTVCPTNCTSEYCSAEVKWDNEEDDNYLIQNPAKPTSTNEYIIIHTPRK